MFRQAIWEESLLIEKSRVGRRAYSLPAMGAEFGGSHDVKELIPPSMQRREKPNLPELSEPEIIRHFIRLSQMNFAIDLGTYPLGSCTMKYNPKISERIAKNPAFANLHPYQSEDSIQGALGILYDLGEMLCEISGMDKFSLAPAAGAQGEYVGALIIRNYLRDHGRSHKDEMLVPDSAHGTNPASAAMAGFKVVKVPSSNEGIVTEESVKKVLTENTAGMMLTVPSTLGIFEREIVQVTKLIHENGGLMYYDGANMNALLGRVRPGDMGFDIIHLNVHKTFATPHGGGGPGAGPVGVKRTLSSYLPIPRIVKREGERYGLDYSSPESVGQIKCFYGNSAVLLRAYCYIMSLGRDGLKKVSEQAVLASNYLLSQLDRKAYSLIFSESLPRKHEFVVSATRLKKETGVTAGDVAKAILDYGAHSPTTYFPLVVDEALMVEPTETETLESLDEYARILNEIAKAARATKTDLVSAPHNTSIGRLDEYKASHPSTMILTWKDLRDNKEKKKESAEHGP